MSEKDSPSFCGLTCSVGQAATSVIVYEQTACMLPNQHVIEHFLNIDTPLMHTILMDDHANAAVFFLKRKRMLLHPLFTAHQAAICCPPSDWFRFSLEILTDLSGSTLIILIGALSPFDLRCTTYLVV